MSTIITLIAPLLAFVNLSVHSSSLRTNFYFNIQKNFIRRIPFDIADQKT
ncbi:hypothetical protein [Halobacillus sp. B29]